MGVGGQGQVPTALPPPGKKPSAPCVGDWVGPRAGLNECGKSHPHLYSIPGLCSP